MENYIIKDRGNNIVYIYHAFYFPFGYTFTGTVEEANKFCEAKEAQEVAEQDHLNDILDR